MTEAEAESFIHRAFLSEEDGAPVEHGMLIDSTQFLTLGGISYMQVAATAVNQAANASMEIGSIFDVATAQSVAYGKHLDKVMKNLNEESLITENLVFSGAYLKSREQLQINSELMTDKNGRQYYEVLRRFQFVYSNTNSPWYSHESKNEVKRRFRLYTKGGKFYTLKRGNINPVSWVTRRCLMVLSATSVRTDSLRATSRQSTLRKFLPRQLRLQTTSSSSS